MKAKKAKFTESQKIKEAISRTVNTKMELELRGRASNTVVKVSSAQKAVADHHQGLNKETGSSIKIQGDIVPVEDQKME